MPVFEVSVSCEDKVPEMDVNKHAAIAIAKKRSKVNFMRVENRCEKFMVSIRLGFMESRESSTVIGLSDGSGDNSA